MDSRGFGDGVFLQTGALCPRHDSGKHGSAGTSERSCLHPPPDAFWPLTLPERRVVKAALISRFCILLVAFLSRVLFPAYDTSAEYIVPSGPPDASLASHLFGTFLRALCSWDAVYFSFTAQAGYIYEMQHAFFPLLPMLMRLLSNTLLLPLNHVFPYEWIVVFSGILISNAAFLVCSVNLYRLSWLVLGSERAARISALFFCLGPAGIFMSSVYSESLFTMLTSFGLLYFECGALFKAALFWCLSCTTRSNGILFVGFFLYRLWRRLFSAKVCLQQAIAEAVQAVLCSLVVGLGLFLVLLYGYCLYCPGRPWCYDQPFPNIYSFAQSSYWNVGLLNYYRPSQIPNFLLALPMVLFSLSGIYAYCMHAPRRVLSLGLVQGKPADTAYALGWTDAILVAVAAGDGATPTTDDGFYRHALVPYIFLWAFLLVYCCLFVHIQIITRLLSFLPPVYWRAASLFIDNRHRRFLVSFIVLYAFIGAILFACFYPPA